MSVVGLLHNYNQYVDDTMSPVYNNDSPVLCLYIHAGSMNMHV
jgi:hypothetical protein